MKKTSQLYVIVNIIVTGSNLLIIFLLCDTINMKGDGIMSTSTFERKIEITSKASLDKIAKILSDETPVKPISVTPYTKEDRDRGEQLLNRLLSHSKP